MCVVTSAHPRLEDVFGCTLCHRLPEPEAVLKGIDVQKVAGGTLF